jgi:integrase
MTVDPIRKLKDIKSIAELLKSSPRDHLLFVMGINNGLRAGDLLRLKVGDVRHLKPGEHISIRESKTGKDNILLVNKTVYKALRGYLGAVNPEDSDYLFKSRKGINKPVTIQHTNYLVKKWTAAINLKGNFGAHSLRKTFGYIQRTDYGIGFEVIAKRYNHSNPAVTMRYLGIQDKEVQGILMNEIG